ncbi:ribonuclease H1-like [Watersipora subatra]|uniref:ribonuclease H1-like n=1 Tax=Watersipora subatra TaxID=2589382 RepID=UPI00355BC062
MQKAFSRKLARFFSSIILSKSSTMSFYAVKCGKQPGIYNTWNECSEQVHKFPGARYKKFSTRSEALEFIKGASISTVSNHQRTSTTTVSHQQMESTEVVETWLNTSKQAMLELIASFSLAIPKLDKCFSAMPQSLKGETQLEASFTEAKADVLVCKETIRNLLHQLNGKVKPDCGAESAVQKRHLDEEIPSSEHTKRQKSSESTCAVPVVYTDGACFNNGKYGARAGIGVWWGVGDERNVSERLTGRQTNNRAEICAACKAIEQATALGYERLEIRTDSKFMIDCMTKWIKGWKKNQWQISSGGPVKNKEELQILDKLCSKVTVQWTHVRGHHGIEGNEHADRLANGGAQK